MSQHQNTLIPKLTLWIEVALNEKEKFWYVHHSPIPNLYTKADTLEELHQKLTKIVQDRTTIDGKNISIKLITIKTKVISECNFTISAPPP